MSEGSFRFNPFGDELSSGFGYDNVEDFKYLQIDDEEDSSKRSLSNTMKIVLAVNGIALIILLVALVVNVMSMNAARNTALQKMSETSKAMQTVQTVFSSSSVATILEEESKGQTYSEQEKEALGEASGIARKVEDFEPVISPGMPNRKAGVNATPYFRLCELMEQAPGNIEGLDSAYSSCDSLAEVAVDMVREVVRFNAMVTGFGKYLSFGVVDTTPLPDISAS